MPTFKPLWVTDPIQYLLLCRFPHLRVYEDATKNLLAKMSLAKKAELSVEVTAYRDELEALTDVEIEERVEAARPIEDERLRLQAISDEGQRPFNQPYAKANFEHWAKMSYWSIDEAVALSLGRDPKVASWKAVESVLWTSAFAREFSPKREVAMRAQTMGQLWERTSPSTFLAWAERMQFSMPAELVEAVKALGIQICDWKTLYEKATKIAEEAQASVREKHAAHMASMADHSQAIDKMRSHQNELSEGYQKLLAKGDELVALKDERIESLESGIVVLEAKLASSDERPLGTRERDSLLKLIIGMAVDGYGYDPKAVKSPIAKELSDSLERLGISLNDDTIRNFLKQAKDLLPGAE
ncbi:hypothetical protein ACG873_24765 [Mesorhizobium sp. AaZ16]|uniref:hypothetical protein n=1 Tax=Mesorhizobium sp. AaZ16 TaxID=3402289 RepID=UPI00374F97F7